MLNASRVTFAVAVCLAISISRSGFPALFIRGDVDESGAVELTDSIEIFGYLFLGDPSFFNCEDAADANDTDGIDISDGIYLLNYLFGGGAPPPTPFPACGIDRFRRDGLACNSHEFCKPPPCYTFVSGKVDIGGYGLFAQSGGANCPPTVVFDAGLGDIRQTWELVSGLVARLALVVRYDRAGLGDSDPGPLPRTSETMVTELHSLLQNAGFDPPYVLVGHSLGGLHIRRFAIRYPQEVAGLVFVDPVHEQAYTRWAEEFPDIYRGWLRDNDAFLGASPGAFREWSAFKEILPGLGNPGPLPDVPVAILTSQNPISPGGIYTQEFVEAFREIWFQAHEELARSVRRSVHILADQSGHQVHQDQPQLVIDAIQQILTAAQ